MPKLNSNRLKWKPKTKLTQNLQLHQTQTKKQNKQIKKMNEKNTMLCARVVSLLLHDDPFEQKKTKRTKNAKTKNKNNSNNFVRANVKCCANEFCK